MALRETHKPTRNKRDLGVAGLNQQRGRTKNGVVSLFAVLQVEKAGDTGMNPEAVYLLQAPISKQPSISSPNHMSPEVDISTQRNRVDAHPTGCHRHASPLTFTQKAR